VNELRFPLGPLVPLPEWDSDATWATFPTGAFHQEYMGLELQKSVDDLERYSELVEISQPDLVIETGTRKGGSAMWFHRELDLQVVTIDIAPQFDRNGMPPWNGPGIQWVRGSSINSDLVEQVRPLLDGKRIMVSLDSDHHSPHVQAEMAIWGGFVSPGCYLVIEDACFEQWDPSRARVGGGRIPEMGGPQHAMIAQGIGLGRASVFWRDEELERRTPISHSPMGWWRRAE
jgi:cephalosporin hydroxylase